MKPDVHDQCAVPAGISLTLSPSKRRVLSILNYVNRPESFLVIVSLTMISIDFGDQFIGCIKRDKRFLHRIDLLLFVLQKFSEECSVGKKRMITFSQCLRFL